MNFRNGLLLASLVITSSLLGIIGAAIALRLPDPLPAIVIVWGSPVADLVFVAGTVGAGILSYRLCRRSYLAALIVALVANAAVYAAAFAIVVEVVLHDPSSNVLETARFAVVGGWVGLLFATLAPAGLAFSRKPPAVTAAGDETLSENG